MPYRQRPDDPARCIWRGCSRLLPATLYGILCLRSVEELSLSCGVDSVRLRSYQDWNSVGLLDHHTAAGLPVIGEFDSSGGNKAERAKRQRLKGIVVTESAIANSELATRSVHETCLNNPLIFTLAELKHFVALCELTDEELFVFAQAPGHPILITNTRKPALSAEQQRAAAMERQRQQQQQRLSEQDGLLTAEDGREGGISSLVPPSPASVAGSEYSYSTAGAMEQSQRTWSGELILSKLAPDVSMPNASFSPDPSPSPAPTNDSSQPTPQPTQVSSQPLPNRQQQQLLDRNGAREML